MPESESFVLPVSEQIRAVLAFIPQLENPTEPFYKCAPEITVFDPYIYSPTVDRLIHALYENNFVQPFDWGSWQNQARTYMENPARVGEVDLETIVKLFTTIVRSDRFCSGTIAGFLNNGFILALLNRLKNIAGTGS